MLTILGENFVEIGRIVRSLKWVAILTFAIFYCGSTLLNSQTLNLDDAIKAAEVNNRSILTSELDRKKAVEEVYVARTQRLPIFSLTALGSQPLSHLGLTLEKGSLGVYPTVGPIPGRTTTLENPLGVAGIFFANIAEPLTQHYKIGLGIQLACVGEEAAKEHIRSQRQSVANDVRRLYYGILQTESGRASLQATVDFLRQLDQETDHDTLQRVALKSDSFRVKAQLTQAEYELLKLDDPLQTQKQQLNRLMGRDVDTPFEVDPLTTAGSDLPDLKEACARALASRPEIRLAKLQVRRATLTRRIANAERIPDVSLAATALSTVNLSSSLPSKLSGVGVQMNWDVFDWGRKRKQVEEDRQAEEQASLHLKDVEALVIVDVSHRYRQLIEARKELEVTTAMQSAARELVRVTTNQFTQKQALLSDVLKAQSGLAESNHHFTQALLDLATTQADFDKAIGEDQ
jgi:outer membrane protein